MTKRQETKYSICIYCFRCYRRKFMVIFFQTEKTPEGRDLKGITPRLRYASLVANARRDLKGRTFMKDYSIDIALGKENLR